MTKFLTAEELDGMREIFYGIIGHRLDEVKRPSSKLSLGTPLIDLHPPRVIRIVRSPRAADVSSTASFKRKLTKGGVILVQS